MFLRITGILLLISGAALIITGVARFPFMLYPDSDPDAIKHAILFIVGGGVLCAAGAFSFAFSFSGGLFRFISSNFRRYRGQRVDEEIARLAKLRADGFITGEEYEAAKKKLLGDL